MWRTPITTRCGINLGAGGGGENGIEKGVKQSGNERTAPNEEQRETSGVQKR